MPWEQNQREAPSDTMLRGNCFYYIFYSKAEEVLWSIMEERRNGWSEPRIPVPGYICQYLQPGSKKGSGTTAPVVMTFSKSGSERS